ncbi:sensor histidine kinase, partial [Streptococcus pneumoniae]|nr:sensor histidine kinase [Streptococcus pneumoniae]
IKTPITSIQATVEGILDGIIKESEQAHYLATIGRQTERLNKLVEELNFLTLNTARNQVETTSKDSIFLDKLLIECMSEFQFLIEQERRDVHLQVIPESARIEGDYAKLSRILVNLVDNAFKYSAPGTKLEVVAKLEKDQLSISVTDEGQGIAPEDLENIFKRLYRVETSRNMKTGGHGLGLAIARELAHQLGGEITVSSQYGLGSTFTLVLNLSGSENKA